MRHRITFAFALAMIGASVLIGASMAMAAPVSLEEVTVFVQLYPEEQPGLASMVAYCQLQPDVKLPATVRIPIPEGAEPFWVGEVFGPASSEVADKEREYKVVDADGGPAVEVTLEETRTILYEATTGALAVEGGRYGASWTWVQSVPSKDVQFSVTFPPAATLIEIDPAPVGTPRLTQGGRQMFFLSPSRLASGESTTVAVRYSRANVVLPEVEQPGAGPSLMTWLLAVLGLAVVALIVVVVRESARRRALADSADGAADDSEDAE